MTIAACQAEYLKASLQLPSQQCSSLSELTNRPATVSFNRTLPTKGLSRRGGVSSSISRIVCAAEGNGSCCGGSGSDGTGSGGGSCSSHGKKAPPLGVAGVGAEFENMVSRSTMQEFEREYDTGEMQGTITRDVVSDVVNEIPELLKVSNEEKFVDVDAILNEASSLTNDNFVFDAELEEMMV